MNHRPFDAWKEWMTGWLQGARVDPASLSTRLLGAASSPLSERDVAGVPLVGDYGYTVAWWACGTNLMHGPAVERICLTGRGAQFAAWRRRRFGGSRHAL